VPGPCTGLSTKVPDDGEATGGVPPPPSPPPLQLANARHATIATATICDRLEPSQVFLMIPYFKNESLFDRTPLLSHLLSLTSYLGEDTTRARTGTSIALAGAAVRNLS
jgi:hypothetical protein